MSRLAAKSASPATATSACWHSSTQNSQQVSGRHVSDLCCWPAGCIALSSSPQRPRLERRSRCFGAELMLRLPTLGPRGAWYKHRHTATIAATQEPRGRQAISGPGEHPASGRGRVRNANFQWDSRWASTARKGRYARAGKKDQGSAIGEGCGKLLAVLALSLSVSPPCAARPPHMQGAPITRSALGLLIGAQGTPPAVRSSCTR